MTRKWICAGGISAHGWVIKRWTFSSGTLDRAFVSRGVTFNAESRFKNEESFDWYRFGAGWRLRLLEEKLEIKPKVEITVLDFNYKLSSGNQRVSRSYAKGAGRLGVEGRICSRRV